MVSPGIYAAFIGFVLAMLLVDLKFFHRDAEQENNKQSAIWVGVWVGLALAFGGIVYVWLGSARATEYFAGYLIEYSLSVDNMFVFIVIFEYFQVPAAFQHRVLFFGILGAIIFRGIFILLGAALLENLEWIIFVFGGLLILTGVRIARGTSEVAPERNPILRLFNRWFKTSTQFDGQKLLTVENGRRVATPLLVVLLVIESTDIVFAIDSIPAIFAITRDPFIVLTSNLFAVLGLRALYFLIAGSMQKFHLLKYGLAVILAFVGTKMILSGFHIHISIGFSLAVVISVLLLTALLSMKVPPKEV
ncbi:MAG: TerC family protein [Actinomycetota bacterium]